MGGGGAGGGVGGGAGADKENEDKEASKKNKEKCVLHFYLCNNLKLKTSLKMRETLHVRNDSEKIPSLKSQLWVTL